MISTTRALSLLLIGIELKKNFKHNLFTTNWLIL